MLQNFSERNHPYIIFIHRADRLMLYITLYKESLYFELKE